MIMKHYQIFAANSLLVGSLFFSSCTGKFIEYNTNPYEATSEQMGYDDYNLQSALIEMEGNVIPVNPFLYQFMESSMGNVYGGYMSDSNDGFIGRNFSTYSPEEHWYQFPFNNVIPKIYPNHQKIVTKAANNPIAIAVADILKVAAIHRVTDIYGHIPYSKIGANGELKAPYDHQREIYKLFFEQLDGAVQSLMKNRTSALNANADKVYKGVVDQWIKFANSLKLRLAMRIVYADPTLARTKAEEAVQQEVGTLASNSDNAYNPVVKSPIREIMYDYNGGDSRISADITSYMNGYRDPRREMYFQISTFTGTGSDQIQNGYHGLRNGIALSSSAIAQKYSNVNMEKLEGRLMWMNAAECAFLKAEGALRGWNMGGTAESFYQQGIRLSFEQWGVTGADSYLMNETNTPESYRDPMGVNNNSDAPSTITIKWNNASDFETNLERIITQKWIANFPLGNEAWAEFRRTGYPRLMKVLHNLSKGIVDDQLMARRLPYPQSEYNENTENLKAALEMLGGPDNLATRVWWDSNSRIRK